jgi:hypothetical protein
MVFGLVGLALLLWLTPGCTRRFFRNAADKEVNDILAEKDRHLAWKIEQWHVYPDPRARFADPTNPDRPPMPPDDPTADRLAPHPQAPGHAGVARVEGTGYLEILKVWDAENRDKRKAESEAAEKVESDQPASGATSSWRGPIQQIFDVGQSQGFLLTLDQAVEMGVINNRTYQDFREDLYLATLPVTQQRFSFVWQWAATEQAIRQWAGAQSLEGPHNNWSLGTTVGVSKLFSTGALLTAAFANNTIFNFLGGTKGFTSQSTINLDLVQPLLRGGGRAVNLEPLTQAERTLVYDIRAYYRFREQFFMNVAVGTSLPGSLAAAAGVTPGGSPISILAALGIASTDVSGGFVGYLSTLYRELDMASDKKWVADLEKALKIYEGYQEGGLFSPLQVSQVRSQWLNAKNTVLGDEQFVMNALDQFKLVLGVPANMPLVLDDSPARGITQQYDRYYKVIEDAENAYKLVEGQEQIAPEKMRDFLRKLYTTDPLVQGTEFQKRVGPVWDKVLKLNDKELSGLIEKLGKERRRLLDLKTDLEMKAQTLSPEDQQLLRDSDAGLDLANLEQLLRRYEQRSWEKRPKEQQAQERIKQFRLVAYWAEFVLVAARNERFDKVGTLWPELPLAPLPDSDCVTGRSMDLLNADVDEAQEAAVQTALTNRVDLMNARAQVVDAWRQIRVTANALMGFLNVQYHLDSTTPPTGSNPLAFSTSRTNSELILNGSLPLVRLVERNNYRTALIDYQRARRNLINLEDSVAAQVRFDVRQLHLFADNYRIQQKVVEAFYSQVENALEVIVAPSDPDNLKSTGTAGQANAAALTNQYLQALSGLNGSQTRMYDIWLSYLATRMQLYLDLERLTLDNRGVWTDEFGKANPGQPGFCPQWGPAQAPLGLLPDDWVRAASCWSVPVGGRPAGQPAGPRPRFLPPSALAPNQ